MQILFHGDQISPNTFSKNVLDALSIIKLNERLSSNLTLKHELPNFLGVDLDLLCITDRVQDTETGDICIAI